MLSEIPFLHHSHQEECASYCAKSNLVLSGDRMLRYINFMHIEYSICLDGRPNSKHFLDDVPQIVDALFPKRSFIAFHVDLKVESVNVNIVFFWV